MARYHSRPVEIDAIQFALTEHADPLTFYGEPPEWLTTALHNGTVTPVFAGEDYWYLDIATLEGVMRAGPDWWIIRGTEGELYPCKPSVFARKYQPAHVIEADEIEVTTHADGGDRHYLNTVTEEIRTVPRAERA